MEWIHLAQDENRRRALVTTVTFSLSKMLGIS
jgi:hypothetical protein